MLTRRAALKGLLATTVGALTGTGVYGVDSFEDTPELRFPNSVYVYGRMGRTDGQTGSVLRAIRLAILAHHYRQDWPWTGELMPDAAARLETWRSAGPGGSRMIQ